MSLLHQYAKHFFPQWNIFLIILFIKEPHLSNTSHPYSPSSKWILSRAVPDQQNSWICVLRRSSQLSQLPFTYLSLGELLYPPSHRGSKEGWKEGVGRDSQTSEMRCGTLVAVGAQRRYIYSWLKGQRRFRLPGHICWLGCATEHWQKELHWFDWNQANRSENRDVFKGAPNMLSIVNLARVTN